MEEVMIAVVVFGGIAAVAYSYYKSREKDKAPAQATTAGSPQPTPEQIAAFEKVVEDWLAANPGKTREDAFAALFALF